MKALLRQLVMMSATAILGAASLYALGLIAYVGDHADAEGLRRAQIFVATALLTSWLLGSGAVYIILRESRRLKKARDVSAARDLIKGVIAIASSITGYLIVFVWARNAPLMILFPAMMVALYVGGAWLIASFSRLLRQRA